MMNWIKSTHCSGDLTCVWVNIEPETVAITSNGSTSTTIWFTHPEWEAFISGVKDGEFDLK
jgi:hypothetical protein